VTSLNIYMVPVPVVLDFARLHKYALGRIAVRRVARAGRAIQNDQSIHRGDRRRERGCDVNARVAAGRSSAAAASDIDRRCAGSRDLGSRTGNIETDIRRRSSRRAGIRVPGDLNDAARARDLRTASDDEPRRPSRSRARIPGCIDDAAAGGLYERTRVQLDAVMVRGGGVVAAAAEHGDAAAG